jgi:hypothetical protein
MVAATATARRTPIRTNAVATVITQPATVSPASASLNRNAARQMVEYLAAAMALSTYRSTRIPTLEPARTAVTAKPVAQIAVTRSIRCC